MPAKAELAYLIDQFQERNRAYDKALEFIVEVSSAVGKFDIGCLGVTAGFRKEGKRVVGL